MKVTVLGAGSIGQRHVKGLVRTAETTGVKNISVFDKNSERMKLCEKYGTIVSSCNDFYSSILNSDAVFVCVPTSIHIDVMNKLFSKGKFHIFMEKPLDAKAQGWESLIENHANHGKEFVVGYMLRKHPVIKRLKDLILSNTIGKILHARAESGFYLPYWHPHEDYRDFYMSKRSGGGGALLDTSHEIDYLTWLFGNVNEVQATIETISNLEITSDDLSILNCKFISGVRAEIHLDLLQFDEERYCKVIGSEGVIISDLAKGEVKIWKKDSKIWDKEVFNVQWDNIYDEEYLDFFEMINGKRKKLPSAKEALHVLEIIEAARKSSVSGSSIKLPLWDI
jgi:predicted dehydrogenase